MDALIVFGVILGLAAIVGIYLWVTYNGLVTLNVRVDEAWSDITVQLKRRADLIPNLIEAVKGYAAHEKEVFESVTKAPRERNDRLTQLPHTKRPHLKFLGVFGAQRASATPGIVEALARAVFGAERKTIINGFDFLRS
jgi:hypothetical protein